YGGRTHRVDHQCRPRAARAQELAVCVQLVWLMQRRVPGQNRPSSATIHLAPATRPVRTCAKRKTIQHQVSGGGTQSAVAVSNRRPTRAKRASNIAALPRLQPLQHLGPPARSAAASETIVPRVVSTANDERTKALTTSKQNILESIRRNRPAPTELPDLQRTWTTYPDPRAKFIEMVEAVGGRV